VLKVEGSNPTKPESLNQESLNLDMFLMSVSTLNKFQKQGFNSRNSKKDKNLCLEDRHHLPDPKALIKIEKSVETSICISTEKVSISKICVNNI
jgi:hypothetical protein